MVLDWIAEGRIKLSYNIVKLPSPFALNLLLQGHTDLMKLEDKQEFLQRMHKVYLNEIEKKTGVRGTKVDEIDYDEFFEDAKERFG